MATFAVVAIWFAPLLGSHPTDADQFLIHASAIPAFDHISAADAYAKLVHWYRGDYPGWFPVAPLPLALWLTDAPLTFVDGLQYALVLLSFAAFARLARLLFAKDAPAILAVVIALCAWQIRSPHDPVAGTFLITAWPGFLLLISFALLLEYRNSPKTGWLVACHIAFALALLTGTVAWGVGCAFLIIAFMALPNRWSAFSLTATFAVIIAVVCIAAPPSAPWIRSNYARDVVAQLLAAFPTSYRAFGHLPVGKIPDLYLGTRYVDDRFINVPAIALRQWIAVAGLAALALVTLLDLKKRVAYVRTYPVVAGLGLLLAPAIALGATSSWSGVLPLGQAFDVVYLEYFGFALLAAVAFAYLSERLAPAAAAALPLIAALAVFLLGYGNVRADGVAYARGARIDLPRSLIQRAGGVGFFDVLPAGTIIALDPRIPDSSETSGIRNPAYMLFHYSGRRYRIVSQRSLGAGDSDRAWLLRTSLRGDMLVSLSRFAGRRSADLLSDQAYGFTLSPDVVAYLSAPQRGMKSAVTHLADGQFVSVSRTCGAVAAPQVFDANVPTVDWPKGFFPGGPVGYPQPAALTQWVPWGVGLRSYAKMYMESRGEILIHPSACRSTSYLIFSFIAITGGPPGLITVTSPNHVDHVAIGSTPGPPIVFEYQSQPGKSIRLTVETDAPSADLDPIEFRYERDLPRDLHIMIEPQEISENRIPYSARAKT